MGGNGNNFDKPPTKMIFIAELSLVGEDFLQNRDPRPRGTFLVLSMAYYFTNGSFWTAINYIMSGDKQERPAKI